MSKATCIMVQGTMSGAGKSLLCAALCRIFAQDGWRVAPFKSQNMALNSFVTRDGLEMGRAQVVQAQAAGVEPDVRMNPILLKPSSDVGSQVIVNGEIRGQMSAVNYFRMKRQLIPDILEAYNGLAAENDVIVNLYGIFFTLTADFSSTCASSFAVVAVSSLSATSVAVGPSSRFPCTVGVTRTPLPYFPGSWKIVEATCPPASLSRRI